MDRAPFVEVPRFRSRRQRAAELQARMLHFSPIYNAAYIVRDSWHGSEERRQRAIRNLADVLLRELQTAHDLEAAIYAVADAITCSPLGCPWET